MRRKDIGVVLAALAATALIAAVAVAQRGPGRGRNQGFRGGRQDSTFAADREDFHFLLSHGVRIRRTVKNLKKGIETVTESDDKRVAARIQKHVAAMYARMDEQRPIRMRDPLFRELFRNAKKVEMTVKNTASGVRVTATSDDPYVVKLIQEHAQVVSRFISKGYAEAHKNHELPHRTGPGGNDSSL